MDICPAKYYSDHFRRKETKPSEKEAAEVFLFYMEEKHFLESSLVIVRLKSWSQMLFRKIQESQKNMLSTSFEGEESDL